MKRTIVLMGPQHPVLIEPVVLDLVLEDELVVDAIPRIGYIHRGLEAMIEKVEFTDFGTVAERICGICSFMHGMGYCLALEELMKVEVPERARFLRVVWAELSRIQSPSMRPSATRASRRRRRVVSASTVRRYSFAGD